MAPEYANTGLLNEKSDVYSFGVLLLEAVTGRDPVDYGRPANEVSIYPTISCVLCMLQKSVLLEIILRQNNIYTRRDEFASGVWLSGSCLLSSYPCLTFTVYCFIFQELTSCIPCHI